MFWIPIWDAHSEIHADKRNKHYKSVKARRYLALVERGAHNASQRGILLDLAEAIDIFKCDDHAFEFLLDLTQKMPAVPLTWSTPILQEIAAVSVPDSCTEEALALVRALFPNFHIIARVNYGDYVRDRIGKD